MRVAVVAAVAAVAVGHPATAFAPIPEILFVGRYDGVSATVLVIGPDRIGLRFIARVANPRWSPNGGQIVYQKLGGETGQGLALTSAQGGVSREITTGDDTPWD